MPPTPRAAISADIFTLKHVSKTKQQPKPHTMPRIILMKIELWGMEVSSRCIIWRSHFTSTWETTAMAQTRTIATISFPSKSPPVILEMKFSKTLIYALFPSELAAHQYNGGCLNFHYLRIIARASTLSWKLNKRSAQAKHKAKAPRGQSVISQPYTVSSQSFISLSLCHA